MKGRIPVQIKKTFGEDAESFQRSVSVKGRTSQKMSLYHPIPRRET
jgi:hypothetical protein